jgi:hypothetical protein
VQLIEAVERIGQDGADGDEVLLEVLLADLKDGLLGFIEQLVERRLLVVAKPEMLLAAAMSRRRVALCETMPA